MSLLSIPLELLDDIIDLTLPSGLEAFALTCRPIYNRASPQIKKHNELKKKWRVFKHREPTTTIAENDALIILRDIVREPLVAEYIEFLNLLDTRVVFRGRNKSIERQINFLDDAEVMSSIKELVFSSEYLKESDIDQETWWAKVLHEARMGDDDNHEGPFTLIALLSLLPNVKALSLPHWWREMQFYGYELQGPDTPAIKVLDRIIECTNSGKDGVPLGKLRSLLPFMVEGYEERLGLQLLEPFFTMQNIHSVYAISCVAVHDRYTGILFEWRHSPLNSRVRRLELAYCCIDSQGIGNLLTHTPHLEVFRYSHQTKWHGCQHDWNAGKFVQKVAECCGDTLTHVTITTAQRYGEVENGIDSFKAFGRLRVLEIDLDLFCGPPQSSGQMLGFAARSIGSGEEMWKVASLPCLAAMLPQTLQFLRLIIDSKKGKEDGPDALQALMEGFKDLKNSYVPNLEDALVRYHQNCTPEMSYAVETFAKPEGFQLEQVGESEQQISQWMRDFPGYVDTLSEGKSNTPW